MLRGVRARLGGLHSAHLLLYSVDFHEIEQLQRAGDWERAGARLAEAARALERAGAAAIALCTNTMHKVAGAIERTSSKSRVGRVFTSLSAAGAGSCCRR